MYKQILSRNAIGEIVVMSVQRLSDMAYVPFDPANTDYANFKREINADEAQLEDADGNLMTAEQAKEFVSTLP